MASGGAQDETGEEMPALPGMESQVYVPASVDQAEGGFVDDSDGPTWRSAMVTGPGVEAEDDFMNDDMDGPVYRGLGGLDNLPAVPGLMRQRAFSKYDLGL